MGLASGIVNQTLGAVQNFKGTRDAYVARAVELVTKARQQTLSGTIQVAKDQVLFIIDTAKRVSSRRASLGLCLAHGPGGMPRV